MKREGGNLRPSAISLLLFALVALACDEPEVEEDAFPEQARQAIVGGTVDAGHAAVGAVVMNYFLCSGTLISPRIVVTAAHCILPGDPPKQFGLGPKTSSATEILDVVQAIPHPQYGQGNVDGWTVNVHDIAILVLDKAATTSPMQYRTASIDGLAGAPITFVGFGVTVPGNPTTTGTKMKVSSTIGKVATQGFFNYTSPANPKNTCTGDSGGPAVLNTGGVDEIISVVSGGDEACAENGFNTRVDVHAAWIEQLIEQHDPQGPVPVCGDGVCETGETAAGCPADCGGPVCGDGLCEWGEDEQACPADCKPPVQCGDGECEAPETSESCPPDCDITSVCGDGDCEAPETSESCPPDCDITTVCGDGECEIGETRADCAMDCAPQCGDGVCGVAETCFVCPSDCGSCEEDESGGCGAGCRASPMSLLLLLLWAAGLLSLRRFATAV